jgi:hypothetical protein
MQESRKRYSWSILALLFMPFGLFAPKDFKLQKVTSFPVYCIISVPDVGYFSNLDIKVFFLNKLFDLNYFLPWTPLMKIIPGTRHAQ